MQWKSAFGCLLLMTLAAERSFVDTAPTMTPPSSPAPSGSHQKGAPEIVPETLDANVRDLENLKQSIGKTLEMIKNRSSVVDGHQEAHSLATAEVKENGKIIAALRQRMDAVGLSDKGIVRTQLDIPSAGIHQSNVQRLLPQAPEMAVQQKRTRQEDGNTLEKFGGSQYSPLDMAEYVFWTGDEKGVTLAIEEFLQAGFMSREEAISFLQEIKYNLDYLQSHYSQLGLGAKPNTQRPTTIDQLQLQQLDVQPKQPNNFDLTKLRFQQPNKKSTEFYDTQPKETTDYTKLIDPVSATQQEEDYDELLERLRAADFLYTEYSLEEVIYQLAKVMFTQSLTRGSADAQQALQKFTGFLESEAAQGHISRALEKKVLDVLIASLADTLGEHPDIQALDAAAQQNAERQAVLRQLLQMIPKEQQQQQPQMEHKTIR